MHVLLVDNKTDDLRLVTQCFKHLKISFDIHESASLESAKLAKYDAIILLGGLWYDDPTQQDAHYANELRLIAEAGTPLLGICLGMQLIVSAYGGETMRMKEEHHGKRSIQLTDLGKDLLKWPNNPLVYENHTVGVTICPPQFDILANSEECAEIIKHKTLPIVGVQFHPEKLAKQEDSALVWSSLFSLLGLAS